MLCLINAKKVVPMTLFEVSYLFKLNLKYIVFRRKGVFLICADLHKRGIDLNECSDLRLDL